MNSTAAKDTRVPEGFTIVPVSPSDQGAPLRVCVLARQTPDPVAGHLVLLRDLHDARVYLGGLADAAGRVREWLELWVQNLDGLEGSLPSHREAFSNSVLDARWTRQAEVFRKLNAAGVVWTGWEASHPLPAFLDLSAAEPVQPAQDGGGRWELCRDDKLLQNGGLPAYSTSLHRYLYQPARGADSAFIPVTAGAPESAKTRPLAEVLSGVNQCATLNPQGGLMLAMTFFPLSYEEYVDLLGGKSWAGVEHGKKRLLLDGVYRGLSEWNQAQQDQAHLFLGMQGRAGRFLETYHLKLQLLAEVARQARLSVQDQQLPFLNLGAESFRISLDQPSAGLPILWTARCALVKPGAAFALPVETSEFRYFIRARATASIFLPEGLSAQVQGSGSVRIRKVLPPNEGRTVLEGTLVPQEPLTVSPHDLLWIRLPLTSGRLDLYGHLYAAEAMAKGEVRFRTVAQRLPETVIANLKAAEGVSFSRAPFEVVPLLSSPCDLYSLAVLAVRTFLVDATTTLAIAVDEVLSLGRQAATEAGAGGPLAGRVRSILERDQRYAASLGPHRLKSDDLGPEEAARLMPPDLWCDTLALIVSLFPGLGPDSICQDYGDVPALALETVFNRPLEELEKLLVRSRSLIVVDWTYNQEVQAAIKGFLAREP